MRIMLIQPNYHSGGAEIAGNWPPSWVPYVGGALKTAGYPNIRFVDAMTNDIPDDVLTEIIRKNQPDVVMATAITPMIYKAQNSLKIAKEVRPQAKMILVASIPPLCMRRCLPRLPGSTTLCGVRAKRLLST